ncbi:MAG: heme-binding protein [Methanobacteriota archaeon]|nr:MAG: heme-binding protein [Euryarchaeota archaeon]
MVEHLAYRVASRSGGIEFREYPKTVLARVNGMSDGEAFGLLLDYISGSNDSSSRIAMTAPVVSGGETPERLPMTAPVVSAAGWFSFVMPTGREVDTLPGPKDGRVDIVEVPERTVAALRFRGRANRMQVSAMEAELFGALRRQNIRITGTPFLMRYNPPFVPGFLRRNEVGVEVALGEGDGRDG